MKNYILRKEDCTYIGYDPLSGSYIVHEQLFPESRGWIEHKFSSEKDALSALM